MTHQNTQEYVTRRGWEESGGRQAEKWQSLQAGWHTTNDQTH